MFYLIFHFCFLPFKISLFIQKISFVKLFFYFREQKIVSFRETYPLLQIILAFFSNVFPCFLFFFSNLIFQTYFLFHLFHGRFLIMSYVHLWWITYHKFAKLVVRHWTQVIITCCERTVETMSTLLGFSFSPPKNISLFSAFSVFLGKHIVSQCIFWTFSIFCKSLLFYTV